MKDFTNDSRGLERYSRHLTLPSWGKKGQKKIKAASILLVGVGGLGSPISLYLAGAGVGRLGLMDDDHVSVSNLPRQVLYSTDEVGQSKVGIAQKRLTRLNPDVEVLAFSERLTDENAPEIIKDFDLVLDGTDNMVTRRIINQTCVRLDKPYIFGAVNRFDGQVSVFHASRGPCLECLFPDLPEEEREKTEEELAILNTVPAIVGALQVTEALKLILGMADLLVGRLLLFNALEPSIQCIQFQKKDDCKVCG